MTEADLYFDDIIDDPLIPPQKEYQTAFFLEMRKVAEIRKSSSIGSSTSANKAWLVGDIVIGEFSPRRLASERYEVANLKRRLEQWELQLPNCMRKTPLDETLGEAFWATQLHLAYQ